VMTARALEAIAIADLKARALPAMASWIAQQQPARR